VARVGRDIALALASAHELKDPASNEVAGLIHRDINPRNVMLTFDGIVKVVDFGLARFRGRRVKTAVGLVRGTRQYMAPEQLRDEPLDARTDLYGLGVLLWELLTGRFLVQSQPELERLAAGRVAQRAIELAPQTPEGLDAVVVTCLHPDPAQRFASARELARALERCGVELFDESQLASFVGERLPETQRALQRLVGLAQQPEVDGGAVRAELRSLRSADKAPAPQRVEPVTPERRPQPPPSPPGPPQLQPPPQPGRSSSRPVIAAMGIALLAGLGAWLGSSGAETAGAEAPESPGQAARLRARAALASGDPLLAFEIIRRCVTARGPCAGMDVVRDEAQAMLDASPCGTDDQARAWVDEAYFHRTGAAIDVRLRECTAGKRMHPLAAQALRQRELDRLGPQ
jgi:serine/threonine protein kinase